MKKKRRRSPKSLQGEAAYVCPACGEQIVAPIDASAGANQEFVEDCPVCCHPVIVHVDIDDDGSARAWAESEQDLN